MEIISVNSSRILSVGYNASNQQLLVVFKNGIQFLHQHVPQNFWLELMLAPSLGKYYFDNIRFSFPYISQKNAN
ncbi:MAG: KTSC domain-containing protein [Chitinophagales bacterium]|nr:KTSC domain-containing protein [Bacteroidota bacterium]MCB9044213.1 KTSC domain-containing protein [Chitinophagales bacterium]